MPNCRKPTVTVVYLAALLAMPGAALAWGREGHQVIVILAEHYMRPETVARMGDLLGGTLGARTHHVPIIFLLAIAGNCSCSAMANKKRIC
jgi:hypothetical protein